MPILEKQNKNLTRILIMAEIMENSYFLAFLVLVVQQTPMVLLCDTAAILNSFQKAVMGCSGGNIN